ncbi:Putative nucleoside hydrolase IunH [Mycobacteroides abscessus subsp. abscessus]|uniref:nucleoside hydrolase n=1 Tax=Mycobacteroides abscessus TaxID=36809 RepID=UPI000928FA92|nr:nucleoside hydrolase [Mycobacteroides abscessus]SIK10754.1 Putative nucleoside hydrolase IunH [Mycobacteroides abscessus subsp. abscessus]SKF60054.1 Putative nucleoside hydrolase IunH [Mycobacteroides abscessus subsp. abscessus]
MEKVLFDCDTGIDDSLALLYLLGKPGVNLLGVISTAGNVPGPQVVENNLGWLELLGRNDIDVFAGADSQPSLAQVAGEEVHGARGLGYTELPTSTAKPSPLSGQQAWSDITRMYPGEVVGLITGPCTNLASALRSDPEILTRLRRLVIMGGVFWHPGNTTPTSEWNVAVDPESLQQVLNAYGKLDGMGVPLPILCPLDLTETIHLTPDDVLRLAAAAGSSPAEVLAPAEPDGTRSTASNPVVRAVSDALRFYFEFHRDHGMGYVAYVHDPFAAAVALDPKIAVTRAYAVDVELGGTLTRGTTVADVHGIWNRPDTAQIALSTDRATFVDDLLHTMAGLARSCPSKS